MLDEVQDMLFCLSLLLFLGLPWHLWNIGDKAVFVARTCLLLLLFVLRRAALLRTLVLALHCGAGRVIAKEGQTVLA
jgi:hypothetical protein